MRSVMVYRRHLINAKCQDSVLYCVRGTAGLAEVQGWGDDVKHLAQAARVGAMVCDPRM